MSAYLFDWLEMLLRWLHLVTSVAWIGASFYFVWLDNHLQPPAAEDLQRKGVDGELWAVHGGGFYNPQKYLRSPEQLPSKLYWFYWESYSTWLSGFALFSLVYLSQPTSYLIDPAVLTLSPVQAIAAALGFLVVGCLGYDILCRLFGFKERSLGIAVSFLIAALAYLACHTFASRAAFVITGAAMASMMTWNVLVWIIPGQRKVVAALRAGLPVDPTHGRRGKQRSVHNTYLTLPVVFCMISNHFGRMHTHHQNWLALIGMMLAAGLIRECFLRRHKGQRSLGAAGGGLAILAGVFFWMQPQHTSLGLASGTATVVERSTVFAIIRQRCYGCHANAPTLIGGGPPKGLAFEAEADMERAAQKIYNQVVELKAMPLGNITNISAEERQVIANWYHQTNTEPR